jgi:hypothetical protein
MLAKQAFYYGATTPAPKYAFLEVATSFSDFKKQRQLDLSYILISVLDVRTGHLNLLLFNIINMNTFKTKSNTEGLLMKPGGSTSKLSCFYCLLVTSSSLNKMLT